VLTELTTIAANGAKTISDYGITGKTYTASVIAYEANGQKASATYTNTNGSTTTDLYTAGVLVKETVASANGAKEISEFNIAGKSYVTLIRDYDTKGVLTELTTIAANSAKTISDYGITGKTYTASVIAYEANGQKASATYTNTNGSTTTDLYTAGVLVKETVAYVDGSKQIADYGLTGSYNQSIRTYDAAGTLAEFTRVDANGAHTVQSFIAGRNIDGDTGNDLLQGVGSDTFVFKAQFGNDTVVGFHADTGSLHDHLAFDKAFASSIADLVIEDIGADVRVTLEGDGSVVLKNVDAAAITADDFFFI